MPPEPSHIEQVFAVLQPSLSLTPVENTATLYEDLDINFDGFRSHVLISSHAFAEDWSCWERHPAGDELVLLLAGECDLVFRHEASEHTLSLSSPGDYAIVPKGTWHTARTATPTKLLFITPGEATEHRDS